VYHSIWPLYYSNVSPRFGKNVLFISCSQKCSRTLLLVRTHVPLQRCGRNLPPFVFCVSQSRGDLCSAHRMKLSTETVVWSPIDLLERQTSKTTRFGVWFISFAFIIAQLGANISVNSISIPLYSSRTLVEAILQQSL